MIGRSEEYEKMFRLEGQLWWYRSLHDRVLTALNHRFGDRRNLRILDAGCGTGGLLNFLQQHGYTNLRGIDGSADAVMFCQKRGLTVTLIDLKNLAAFESYTVYDAIICNDVFCYFTNAELLPLLSVLARRLESGGILVSNNNAFSLFRGEHDLAVGIVQRFVRSDFEQLLPTAGLRIQSATYWSFALSPLILLARQWQRLKLKLGWRKPEEAESDVYMPIGWLNEALYQLVRTEYKLLPRTPFGSSLFMEIVVSGSSRKP